MIVVDTNIIIYLYLENERSKYAEEILQRDPDWAAPILWRSEFRNVLALYIRKKIISHQHALNILEEAEKLMNNNEYTIASRDIMELVKHSSCSAYDCEFIALAKELEMPLITEDKKILKEFPKNAINMDIFLNNPNIFN